MMTGFPDLTIKDVDAIVAYINTAAATATARSKDQQAPKKIPTKTQSSSVLSLLFLLSSL